MLYYVLLVWLFITSKMSQAKSLPQIFQKSLSASNKGPISPQNRYLRLLFGALLLEVLRVLTSSHNLKFRSNTHRKGSLLINNKLLNSLAFILSAVRTLQTPAPFPFLFSIFIFSSLIVIRSSSTLWRLMIDSYIKWLSRLMLYNWCYKSTIKQCFSYIDREPHCGIIEVLFDS